MIDQNALSRHIGRLAACALLVAVALPNPVSAAGAPAKEEEPDQGAEVSAFNEGVKLLKKGDCAEAGKRFETALEMKEAFPEAHNNLAYCLRKQGEAHYEEALEHYNRALELAPELAEAYHYRGVLFVLMGEEDKARQDHQTLATLDGRLADELAAVIDSGGEPEGMAGAVTSW